MNTGSRCGLTLLLAFATGCVDFKREELEFCERRPELCETCNFTSDVDLPDDNFIDANCDGVDGIATGGIFVDPVSGTDGAAGTKEAPLRTITEALDRVRQGTEPKQVYLAQGVYNEPNLVLNAQASLYGAYGGLNNWRRRGAENITHLDGGIVGLTVRDVGGDSGIVLERLHVTSANAVDSGTPSIALRVVDAQGVRLRHGTFGAGQGATGTTGGPGTQGGPGGTGGNGGSAQVIGGVPVSGALGAAGTSTCGAGTVVSGGDGKPGGGGPNAGEMGGAGLPATIGGQGGSPGGGGNVVTDPIDGSKRCGAGSGGPGATGTIGSRGSAGTSGDGMGLLSGESWTQNQQGGLGGIGNMGGGGGGGGSGGSCPYEGTLPGAAGGGSGGGGGGGCGGRGGQGGGGGGASISVLLIRSNVSFEGTTVLRTRGGGRGGQGGEGGPGGPGGLGGQGGGGGLIQDPAYRSRGGAGGDGGMGGTGGPGGGGGGGGGGPSVGVWCTDAGYTGSPQDDLGDGGVGGQGSTGGNTGLPGMKVLDYGCTTVP